MLNRLTFASALSHLRRLNTPIAKTGKLAKPRQLHNSHWGMICPAETPEGAACGLVKNLALMAFVSVGSTLSNMTSILEDFGVDRLSEMTQPSIGGKYVKVFVNGNWWGTHNNADDLVKSIMDLRRHYQIPKEVSIVRDIPNKEIRFHTDAGRVQRPLFIVDKQGGLVLRRKHIEQMKSKHGMNFDDSLKNGLIEFLDVEEEETAMIAMHVSDLKESIDTREKAGLLPVQGTTVKCD